jgi:hypothetical protein
MAQEQQAASLTVDGDQLHVEQQHSTASTRQGQCAGSAAAGGGSAPRLPNLCISNSTTASTGAVDSAVRSHALGGDDATSAALAVGEVGADGEPVVSVGRVWQRHTRVVSQVCHQASGGGRTSTGATHGVRAPQNATGATESGAISTSSGAGAVLFDNDAHPGSAPRRTCDPQPHHPWAVLLTWPSRRLKAVQCLYPNL